VLFRSYNTSQDWKQGGDVSFIGGEMKRISGSGICTLDDTGGCFNGFTIRGTNLMDSLIAFGANNIGSVDIDCKAQFTHVGSITVDVVSVQINSSDPLQYKIKASGLSYSGTFSGTSSLVKVTTSSFNYSQTVKVSECYAPSLPIAFVEDGGNAGISGVVHCYSNVVSATQKTNTGAKPLVIARSDNNFNENGVALTL
jgi:hypothetical protein